MPTHIHMEAEQFDAAMGDLRDAGARIVHDCDLAGRRRHLAVARSGIYVVGIEAGDGMIEVVRDGWFIQRRDTVFIGARDCTAWIRSIGTDAGYVRDWVANPAIPVHPIVGTVDVEWPLLPRSYAIDGVTVVALPAIRKRLVKPGPLTPETIDQLARDLAESFTPTALDA